MDTIDLISAIERRPRMFIVPDNLESLRAFVHGFYLARIQAGLVTARERGFIDGFHPWLMAQHRLAPAATWADLILVLAAASGREPVSLFFAEFHQFVENRDPPIQ